MIKTADKFKPIGGGLNTRPFPSIESVLAQVPLSKLLEDKVRKSRKGFQEHGGAQKVLFLGPCSIHDLKADLALA